MLIAALLCGTLTGCTGRISASDLEKIRAGILYNTDESLLEMDSYIDIITELSDIKYLGRFAGTEENKMAADYIAGLFKEAGLKSPGGVKAYKQSYRISPNSEKSAENVMGVIPGTDRDSKEVVIISAHLDHLGGSAQLYYPGALDNASGVASLIEIAKYIDSNRIKPCSTILFIAFNGEESGFTGSKYYAEHPVYPLENCILINLDQIGYKEKLPLYLLSNDEEGREVKKKFAEYASELDIDFKKLKYVRSDHMPLENKGMDVVTLVHPFTVLQGYHTPDDTVDIVSKENAKEVITLVLTYLDRNAY